MLGNSRLSASAAWPDMPGLKIEQRGSEGNDVEGTHDWAEVRGWSKLAAILLIRNKTRSHICSCLMVPWKPPASHHTTETG